MPQSPKHDISQLRADTTIARLKNQTWRCGRLRCRGWLGALGQPYFDKIIKGSEGKCVLFGYAWSKKEHAYVPVKESLEWNKLFRLLEYHHKMLPDQEAIRIQHTLMQNCARSPEAVIPLERLPVVARCGRCGGYSILKAPTEYGQTVPPGTRDRRRPS